MSPDNGQKPAEAAQPKDPAVLLASLVPTLLDFEQMPGRYRLALREPQALFEQTRAVLLLAAGRSVEGLAPLAAGFEAGSAQRAARFFVRTVLLRPGADHYTLLGLAPATFAPEALRDHYRLMIRLTHPDFAASGENWPADAATRINIANDVLGSPEKREAYNATLEAAKPAPPMGAEAAAVSVIAGPGELRRAPRPAMRASGSGSGAAWSQRSKIALAAGGALVCALGLWLMTPSGNDGSLVAQRASPSEASKPKSAFTLASNPEATLAAEQLALANAAAQAAPAAPAALSTAPTQPRESRKPLAATQPAPASSASDSDSMSAGATTVSAFADALPGLPANETNANVEQSATAVAPKPLSRAQERALAQAEWRATRKAEREAAKEAARLARESALALAAQAKALKAEQKAQRNGLPTMGAASSAPAPASVQAPDAAQTVGRSNDNDGAALTLLASTRLTLPRAAVAPEAPGESGKALPSAGNASNAGEPGLTMAQVQPAMSQLMAGLQTGRGENVVRMIETPWDKQPATAAFVNRYAQLLAGHRVAQLGRVTQNARPANAQLVVESVVELFLQAENNNVQVKQLHMSAYFTQQEGRPVLTRVVANTLR